jgi:hypothetical protein
MKKVLIILLLFACLAGTAQAALSFGQSFYDKNVRTAFSKTSNDPLRGFIGEVEGMLDGTGTTTLITNLLFDNTITADPTSTEGRLYYNTTANLLRFHNGSSWIDIEANTGGLSMDGTYNLGSDITVDNGVLTWTAPDAADNVILTLAQSDTGTTKVFTLTNAGTGNTIDIQGQSGGNDIEGTDDTWGVTGAGIGTLVGLVTSTGDVTFTGAATNIVHDASANQMEFKDSSLLVFGSSDDISIAYDGSGDDLNILFDDKEIAFGVDGGGGDIVIFSETGSSKVTFTEATDDVLFVAYDIDLDDNSNLVIGSDDEWIIDNASEVLTFLPSDTTDDFVIALGDATNTTDLNIFGATASTVSFDASGDQVTFNAYDVALGDSDTLEFGDSTDAIIQWNATLLKIDAVTTTAGTALQIETTDGGIHLNADGGTNGDLILDAASVLTLTSVDVKIFDGAAAETWTIEGTADEHEATVVFTDPTADVTWTFPTAAADTFAVMASTLATNAPEIANSVSGGTNQLIFEGTADDHETILTAIDATADATLTLPDDTGAVGYIPVGSTTKDASDAAIPLTHAVVIGTSSGASAWSLPDGNPGQVLTVIIGTDGGVATITPASLTGSGWATMIFTNDGEGASFMFVDATVGWTVLGTFGISTNPLTTQ